MDSGIYRIMNYRRKEIEHFIDKGLIDYASKEFEEFSKTAHKDLASQVEGLAMDIASVMPHAINADGSVSENIRSELEKDHTKYPKITDYLELRQKLESLTATKQERNQVFNDVFTFFSRYYEDGDFIPKRRLSEKGEKYAIPYSGEEVKLYWANFDQYYVKSATISKNFSFSSGGWQITFETTFPDESISTGREERRVFVLADKEPVRIESSKKSCLIQFLYTPITDEIARDYLGWKRSKDDESERLPRVDQQQFLLNLGNRILKFAAGERNLSSVLSSEANGKRKIEIYLEKYTRRITSDFFVHKNLGSFLTRELDNYIKSEILDLDDLRPDRLARARAVSEICKRTILLLNQIEEFEKSLWLKRKFVLGTEYVLSLKTLSDIIRGREFDEILEKVREKLIETKSYQDDIRQVIEETFKQPGVNVFVKDVVFGRKGIKLTYKRRILKKEEFIEWKSKRENKSKWYESTEQEIQEKLQEIWYVDYEPGDATYSLDLTDVYIDTRYFDEDFKFALLEKVAARKELDQVIDGVLIKSDSFHALRLISAKYVEAAKCIYIDPPYNTGNDGFLYKDRYQHSSWLAMLHDRVEEGIDLLDPRGSFYSSIDWNESHSMKKLLDQLFTEGGFQREIIWNTGKNISGFKSQAPNWIRQHDTIYFYAKPPTSATSKGPEFHKLWKPTKKGWRLLEDDEKQLLRRIDLVGDDKESSYIERWTDGRIEAKGFPKKLPLKPIGDVWNDILSFQYSDPRVTESWYFKTQKVENLIRRIIQSSSNPGDLVIDFFAGTGTTAAVAHKLGRKWIAIEMGAHFESKALVRIKSVLVGDNRTHLTRDVGWKGGGIIKYQYVEQYDDTLQNVELSEKRGLKAFQTFDEDSRDEYLMKYFLGFEAAESSAMINLDMFEDPFQCELKILDRINGGGMTSRVDLVETFNYILGVRIQKLRHLDALSRRYVFVEGQHKGKRTLIVWRPIKDLDLEKDRDLIEKFVVESKSEETYINGNAIVKDYKVIEREFLRLMWE